MPTWERRNADTLADAIAKHIRNNPELKDDNESLAIIQAAVDNAANTIATTAGELNRCRAVVCAICRGSNLHECDVPEGCSSNCAFIFDNTTEFAGL